MKRKVNNVSGENENPFSFSIGDLMAGVLFIFVLLLASSMLEIQEKAVEMQKLPAVTIISSQTSTLISQRSLRTTFRNGTQ